MKQERLDLLEDHVSGIRQELGELEKRKENIESKLQRIESLLEAEDVHNDVVTNNDARDVLGIGDIHKVVIEKEPGVDGKDAVTHLQNIVTFVNSNTSFDLLAGSTVKVKVTDVGESHAKAFPLEKIEG